MTDSDLQIAVLIPCRNEERTVGEVVEGFKNVLPESVVYVYDNASTDQTAKKALEAGAVVGFEPRVGKGRVMRRMFADVEADIYIVVDGDATYDPADAPLMLKTLSDNNLDMVAGARTSISQQANRKGHAFGNRMFNWLYRTLFGSGFSDIFTGYRVFSRRLVKSFPSVSSGFEIETELAVHTSQLFLPVEEVSISYAARPEGSQSKLRTYADGFNILRAMLFLLKENRPLLMFGSVSICCAISAILVSVPLIGTYIDTGLVPRVPTLILATGLIVLSILLFALGMILDSVAKSKIETKRIAYLQIGNRNSR